MRRVSLTFQVKFLGVIKLYGDTFENISESEKQVIKEASASAPVIPEGRGGHNRLIMYPFICDAAYSFVQYRLNKKIPVYTRCLRNFLVIVLGVACELNGKKLPPSFNLKKQIVYDLKNHLELKIKKLQKYHPDITRPSFLAECKAFLEAINSNFRTSRVWVVDEIGIHFNIRPLRSLSLKGMVPVCVSKTRTKKISFCVAIRHDMKRESYVNYFFPTILYTKYISGLNGI